MGPEMEMDKRYSVIISQIFIVMTFSGGLPILYPIGILCAFSTYWVDKWLFVKFYRRPPIYDCKMARSAS